ncbi:MAG: thiosulfate oxidation carrier complex protein SoxZ [Gammaproteobacteria bacterium]|nr:thiosulfate oxidation carrier complex protein SoxZ [Gammaproteobacteria bacterium]
MGKPIKIRAKMKGDIAEVKALMPHEMEAGFRRDPATNERVPAHYITDVVAQHNGDVVFTAYWGPAVSKNPFVSFSFLGAAVGDTINVHWRDNKGDSSAIEAVFK